MYIPNFQYSPSVITMPLKNLFVFKQCLLKTFEINLFLAKLGYYTCPLMSLVLSKETKLEGFCRSFHICCTCLSLSSMLIAFLNLKH